MVGITWNKKKYIMLSNDINLKSLSLEDNIYFTLRDIFFNIEPEVKMYKANDINAKLSMEIPYEDRDNTFKYYKLASDSDFVTVILDFLNSIKQSDFNFEYENVEDEVDVNTINSEYICFDVWWSNLEELKKSLLALVK